MQLKMSLKTLRTKLNRSTFTEADKEETNKEIAAIEKQEKGLWDEFLQSYYVFVDPNDQYHGYEDYKSMEPHLWPQVAGAHHYNFEPEETKQLIDNLYVRIAEEEGNIFTIFFFFLFSLRVCGLDYSYLDIQKAASNRYFCFHISYELVSLSKPTTEKVPIDEPKDQYWICPNPTCVNLDGYLAWNRNEKRWICKTCARREIDPSKNPKMKLLTGKD